MTQLPIITSFHAIAETVLSAKTADADYYSIGKFYIWRKKPRVEFFRAPVLPGVSAGTVGSYNIQTWAGIFRNKMKSKTYDLFKSSSTKSPRT